MSNPQATRERVAPMKAQSHRDSLAKTVRLLTKSGIDVQFRGHMPHVMARGNKAVRLVLPELNDNAPPELIDAIAGYLDHEVGHIYYTPFAKMEAAGKAVGRRFAVLLNIVEDIRLEKLLPRDLPGTRENLDRMYEKAVPYYFGPPALEAHTCGDVSEAFSRCIVVGFRALSGQKPFKAFMDDNDLWKYLAPLLAKMPKLGRMLREVETYDDVIEIVEAVIEATKPPPPPPPCDKEDEDDEQALGDAKGGTNQSPPDKEDGDLPDDLNHGGDDSDDTDDDGDSNSAGGKGHGDGEGEDDNADEDGGDCAGDDGNEPGNDSSQNGPGAGQDDADKDGEDLNHGGDEKGEINDGPSGEGKTNTSVMDALRQLEPSQRRAIYLYKKSKKTVAEIATDLLVTEDEAVDLLRNARRRLNQLLKGD